MECQVGRSLSGTAAITFKDRCYILERFREFNFLGAISMEIQDNPFNIALQPAVELIAELIHESVKIVTIFPLKKENSHA